MQKGGNLVTGQWILKISGRIHPPIVLPDPLFNREYYAGLALTSRTLGSGRNAFMHGLFVMQQITVLDHLLFLCEE